MTIRAESAEPGTFEHLQQTYFACLAFVGIVLGTTLSEIVLTTLEGGAALIIARLVASLALAFAFGAIVALIAAPILDRYSGFRLERKTIVSAVVFGTIASAPILINRFVR